MKHLLLAIIILFNLIESPTAVAGPSSYVCEIEGAHVPSHRSTGVKDMLLHNAMATVMAIDRETGRVIHPSLGNTSYNTITLLNRGSADWSFKTFADSGDGGHTIYYEVQEFVENRYKPLVVVAAGVAYWGTCQ